MKDLRIGIAGHGFIGQIHAKAVAQIKRAQLVAIAEPDYSKTKGLDWHVRIFADYNVLNTQSFRH
ncbi:MAG: hypothetical protein HZB66_00970 [Candidatus Aenigmarchaeota archaeon]|nr:hypothetical protein [Candidatus Aenigmarchaeota archaeon]